MKIKIACQIIFLFLSLNLLGQEQTERVNFKLYTNFDYSPKYINHESDIDDGYSLRENEKEINGFNFSPALVFFNRKGNSSEIEISRFKYLNKFNKVYTVIDSTDAVGSTLLGSYDKQFELFVRYEYRLHLLKNKNEKALKPIIGFSATPFFQWNISDPVLSNEYPSSKASIGLYLSVIPRIEYAINERWYLDLNIPLALVTTHYTRIRHDSPLLPENKRLETIVDFYNGPVSFAIRFGVGIKI